VLAALGNLWQRYRCCSAVPAGRWFRLESLLFLWSRRGYWNCQVYWQRDWLAGRFYGSVTGVGRLGLWFRLESLFPSGGGAGTVNGNGSVVALSVVPAGSCVPAGSTSLESVWLAGKILGVPGVAGAGSVLLGSVVAALSVVPAGCVPAGSPSSCNQFGWLEKILEFQVLQLVEGLYLPVGRLLRGSGIAEGYP